MDERTARAKTAGFAEYISVKKSKEIESEQRAKKSREIFSLDDRGDAILLKNVFSWEVSKVSTAYY